MKILLIGPGRGYPGGLAAHIMGIARELADTGQDVTYAGPPFPAWFDRQLVPHWHHRRVDGVAIAHPVNPLSVPVHTDLPLRDLDNPDRRLWLRLIRAIRPDVIHVHSFLGWPAASVLEAVNIPRLFTCHEYFGLCQRGTLVNQGDQLCESFVDQSDCPRCVAVSSSAKALAEGRIWSWGGRRGLAAAHRASALLHKVSLAGRAKISKSAAGSNTLPVRSTAAWRQRFERNVATMNSSSRVLAVSQSVREYLLRAGVREELVVVDHPGSAPAEKISATPLPSESGSIRLLFHAGYVNNKGGHILLEAMARLGPGYELRMIGGGSLEYKERLRSLARGCVDIGGPFDREALNKALAESHAVVLPTVGPDTAPNTAFEALAAGRPVVASRIGGLPDFIVDGFNGLLAEPGSAESLASVLARLRERALLEHLASNARLPTTVAEHVRGLVAHYHSVIGDSERSA